MAIYHDAYLFLADDFAEFLKQHEKVNPEEMVLEFMQDEFVLKLSDDYGSWDYQGVKTTLAEYKEHKSSLATFEFIVFLYKYLSSFSKHPDGLGSSWRAIDDENSLDENARKSLVNGHRFSSFVRNWEIDELAIWKDLSGEISPPSTASSLGFLNRDEVISLYQTVKDCKATNKEGEIAFSKTLTMLEAALEAKTGLCLIKSG
jgi:hypothetical protein